MKTLGILLPTVLAGLLAAGALAYDSPTPKAAIPAHGMPWVETDKPDVRTLFLWKFSSDKDRQAELATALDSGALGTLLEDAPGPLDLGRAKAGPTPRLQGGARVVPDAGRFGSGLVLDGSGFAEGAVDWRELLNAEGGFTLDFWFKPTAHGKLCVLHDARGQPLLAVALGADQQVTLAFDGQERLAVPAEPAVSPWHHLAVTLRTSDAQVTLTVDGQTKTAVQAAWLKELATRLGSQVIIGSEFRGAVDEVRLAKGVLYLYPWNIGSQEFEHPPPTLEMRSPFFKSGQVVTRFHFDGTLKPETATDLSWTGQEEASLFQRGLQGQALDLSRINKAGFKLNGFHALPDKNGTIEFWFRPLDWNNFFLGGYDGEGVQYYHLLQLRSTEARYADGIPTKDIEVLRGRSAKFGKLPWVPFHPGTWTHVLISLQDGQQTIYVNGRRQAFWQAGYVTQGHPHGQEPLKKWLERTGGRDVDDTWTWQFAPSPTLLDELSIYSWALNPAEAWNAYARWLPDAAAQMKPLPLLRGDCDYFAHSWDNVEKLVVQVEALAVNQVQPASADILLLGETGETLFSVEKQPLDGAGNTSFVYKKAIPFGRYAVTVRSRDAAGAVLKEEILDYLREPPVWLGNTLGEERTVPKPWTPVAVDGRKLRVIGRELELGANGLPARIETLGRQLLAAPTIIRATTATGTVELTGQGPTFTETAPDRVAWKNTVTGAGLTADLDAWLEFDGLLYCAVTLKPSAGESITVADLDVDVLLKPESATQLLANGGGNDFRASLTGRNPVPEKQGSVWHSLEKPYPAFCRAEGVSNFMPHIWLGADDLGLYFGAENDKGWTVDGPQPAQELIRTEQAVVFRMNIIREATVIPATGRRFHFVLLPTPAKPEPADWRQQMLTGGVHFGAVDTFGGFDLKGGAFRLEPQSWEHAAAMASQCRAKWGRCILYADAAHPELGPAFRDWNHDLFAGTGRLAWTPECEDYAVWAIHEFLKRGLIDGVYWDDVSVGYTYSLAATAYEYAGSPNGRRVGFTALAQRRVNLRLWRLFEAAGKEPCIWAHMTFSYEVPLFSFCRYLSNCEFVTGVEFPKPRDAMDMWSPEKLRWLAGSAKWGTGYANLSTLPRSLPGGPACEQWLYPQQRTETGLYLTSDIMGPADGLGQVLVREKIFDGPVAAYPWWKSAEMLTLTAPTMAQALASVYALEGRAIVLVANRDRGAEHDMTLELDAGRLFPGAQGVTWRDLDPGLKPPAEAMVSANEIKEATTTTGELSGEVKPLDDAALGDLLDGTTPASRALQRLKLRTDGNQARVVVRPRDYRILEARPIR